MRGWLGHSDSYRLVVVDEGMGMPPHAMAQANQRLARSESFTVAPSRSLGHYVAGNLAARHGIRVQLEPAYPKGVVATLDLPPGLLMRETPGTAGAAGARGPMTLR